VAAANAQGFFEQENLAVSYSIFSGSRQAFLMLSTDADRRPSPGHCHCQCHHCPRSARGDRPHAARRSAEAQRQTGQPGSALQLLAELEVGARELLVEKRPVTAVLCECYLGNMRGRSLARDVGHENRSSIYARRLRSSRAADALGAEMKIGSARCPSRRSNRH
jgi:hypothetical protein